MSYGLGHQTSEHAETTIIHVEYHPCNFGVKAHFPNARAFRGWEGGCAFTAERDGKPFIIVDEGTMADFLDENDPIDQQVLSRLVSILEFDDEAERNEYIATKMTFGGDLDGDKPHRTV